RQRFGGDIKGELIAEVKAQHSRARFADCAMRSGYEGSGAVFVLSGSHVGFASVCGFPSVSANCRAVTGRQKWYVYFASKKAIVASARLIFSRAKSRALCSRLS